MDRGKRACLLQERRHHYSTGDECGHKDDRQLRQAAAAAASGSPCLAGSASSRHPAPAWQTSQCAVSAKAGSQALAPRQTCTDALAASAKCQNQMYAEGRAVLAWPLGMHL